LLRIFVGNRRNMAEVLLKGNLVHTSGDIPLPGDKAPDFLLTDTELRDRRLDEFAGKKVVLNVFPSLDTPVCAASVRKFNELAAGMDNTVVLAISKDLPFAHQRFCTSEGIDRVINLSGYKCQYDFGRKYGVEIIDGPLENLYARAVFVINEDGKVIYTQLVPEITQEPDYGDVLSHLK